MGVRRFLSLRVAAERAFIMNICRSGAEFAVGADRKNHDVSARVIGDEKKLSRAVEGKMAGIFTESRELIKKSQLPALRLDRKSA